jgi:hypothetical protein
MTNSISDRDIEFKNQIESCVYPVEKFNHKAHLRLAYIYLCDNSDDAAYEKIQSTLCRYLKYNDIDLSKYHVTITKAWLLAVRHFIKQTPVSKSAVVFINKNPIMLDANIMMTHYSKELLFSNKARESFVNPDLDPIPRYAG